ncbi:hypothetical protein BDZ97DRAFT_2000390, partial [Flammula alnicola]
GSHFHIAYNWGSLIIPHWLSSLFIPSSPLFHLENISQWPSLFLTDLPPFHPIESTHTRSNAMRHSYAASIDSSSNEAILLPQLFLEDLNRSDSPSPDWADYSFSSIPSSPDIEGRKFSMPRFLPLDIDFISNQGTNDVAPSTPSSISSFNNFIEDNYMRPRTPDFSSFRALERRDSFCDTDSYESTRSVSPSICSTAVRVKVTPLRAVRRSIRRSFFKSSPTSEKNSPPGEHSISGSSLYRNVFNVLQRKDRPTGVPNSSVEEKFTSSKSPTTSSAPYTSQSFITRQVFTEGFNEYNGPRNTSSTLAVGPLDNLPVPRRSASFSGYTTLPYPADKEAEVEVMEFHDVTKEAAQIAAMLSFRWSFEPARTVPCHELGVPRSSEQRTTPLRRESC